MNWSKLDIMYKQIVYKSIMYQLYLSTALPFMIISCVLFDSLIIVFFRFYLMFCITALWEWMMDSDTRVESCVDDSVSVLCDLSSSTTHSPPPCPDVHRHGYSVAMAMLCSVTFYLSVLYLWCFSRSSSICGLSSSLAFSVPDTWQLGQWYYPPSSIIKQPFSTAFPVL